MAYGVWPARDARSIAYGRWPARMARFIAYSSFAAGSLYGTLSQRSLERVDPLTQGFSLSFDFLQVLLRNVGLLFGNEKTRDGFKG
jgi:hypothetical protein